MTRRGGAETPRTRVLVAAPDLAVRIAASAALERDGITVELTAEGELAARTRALLRRAVQPGRKPLEFQGITIDPQARTVVVRGQEVTLTRREFDLLLFMASSPGRVFSHDELLRGVWGTSVPNQDA